MVFCVPHLLLVTIAMVTKNGDGLQNWEGLLR